MPAKLAMSTIENFQLSSNPRRVDPEAGKIEFGIFPYLQISITAALLAVDTFEIFTNFSFHTNHCSNSLIILPIN